MSVIVGDCLLADPAVLGSLVAGSNVALSSKFLTSSNTCREVGWMDPVLWSTLSDPFLEKILSYLPLPLLQPMRAVCMKWNHLLQLSRFLSMQRDVTMQCPSYVLTYNEPASWAFSYFQSGPELFNLRKSSLYCPISKKWFNMSLDCLPCRGFYISSVNEGLFCFVGYKWNTTATKREVVHGVCNPATRAFRVIPPWDESKIYNMPHFTAMLVDNSTRSYKIILIDHDMRATRTYDSACMAWTESGGVPSRHNFPYNGRFPNQTIVRGNTLV